MHPLLYRSLVSFDTNHPRFSSYLQKLHKLLISGSDSVREDEMLGSESVMSEDVEEQQRQQGQHSGRRPDGFLASESKTGKRRFPSSVAAFSDSSRASASSFTSC